jgi:hypothetical protein
MIQSPEGVAIQYKTELWSEKHCRLVAKSLALLGKAGNKVLYVPVGAESQYGNAESMVLWIKNRDGSITNDYSRVETYVDLALKHMGKPQFVVVGVWDSCMHVSVPKHLRRKNIRYSLLDKTTGKITAQDGPENGTEECRKFWDPVLKKIRNILSEKGLGDEMLIGYCSDRCPSKQTVGMFNQILPGVGWQRTCHPPTGHAHLKYNGGSVPIIYQSNVWGCEQNHDPSKRHAYGWKYPVNPSLRTWLDRDLYDGSPISKFRWAFEQNLLADRRGMGQIGADFWDSQGSKTYKGGTLVGRFPATSEGNLGIYSGQMLYAGSEGPVPTVRFQMMRENILECEARIFLEKLLTSKPCRLSPELAEKCQNVLDERTRWHRLHEFARESFISWPYSGLRQRTINLFQAAAEAQKEVKSD